MSDFQRQLDILPPLAIVHPVTFIGLGGIGSWTSYTVRKLGFSRMNLWDPDKIEKHNFPSQHFDGQDVGENKADTMEYQLKACLDDESEIIGFSAEPFTADREVEGIVISGVDKMSVRSEIWKSVVRNKAFVPLYIDGRIGVVWDEDKGEVSGEWIEVLTVVPSRIEDREFYEEHLFTDEEAEPLRCTAQAVAYLGPLVAGFIASNLKRWIMKQSYPRQRMYDALTDTMILVP